MGRKVLLTVVCWLTLSQTFGAKILNSSFFKDNESAESAPRLYRNVPIGVYASAVPYGAHSFHLPIIIAAPKTAASQIIQAKQRYMNPLTDSYGNQFLGTPQLTSYKLSLPQQFVPLQAKLPKHLAQPLVAASANFQFKKSNGQFFGAPYRVPALQGPVPTPLHHFSTFGQLYGDNLKYLAPSSVTYSNGYGILNTHQQPTNNKAVFTNTQVQENSNNYKEEPKIYQQKEPQIIIGKPKVHPPEVPSAPNGEKKFERIQAPSYSAYSEPARIAQQLSSLKQGPHQSHEEVKFEQFQDLPHYESKYQIIQDQPQSSQFQRIQEHRPVNGEVKFQRIQAAPVIAHGQRTYEHSQEKSEPQSNIAKQQAAPAKQVITYINDINGEKTIVELETKPNLPLLDLTLLEPLTFDNPLVPQVQHFLPRINQATYQKLPDLNKPVVKNYQKEFVVEKTTSYDNAEGLENLQKNAHRSKQAKPTPPKKHSRKNESPKKTTVTHHHHETLDDAPEITYEISSPNYKETVKEKSISYNMKTESEPVHYTYGSKLEKEPVTYSYSRTSNEPAQITNVQYQGNGPSHLIYNFKPDEQRHEEKQHNTAPHNTDAGDEKESSHESVNDTPPRHHQHHGHTEQYQKQSQPSKEHHEHVQNEKKNYNEHKEEKQHQVIPESSRGHHEEPEHFTSEEFQPILKEYEDNIRILAPSASIKVDPHQHVQPKSRPEPHQNHGEEPEPQHLHYPHSSPAPQEESHSSPPEPHSYHQNHHLAPHSDSYNGPGAHIHEKSKQIIIQEEAPDEMHMLREQMRQEVVNREENSEEDFEKAYEDAAIGFPAYNKKDTDSEKDIFDPESYGVPRDHIGYDFDHTPLQQYQAEGDEFPKEARSSYKDSRDKLMQNYYTDFSVSKPEGLLDRYQNKLGYYKLFKEQKPDYLVDYEQDDKKQKSAKLTAAPSYDYLVDYEKDDKNHKQKSDKYLAAPSYEYLADYERDNKKQKQKSAKFIAAPSYEYLADYEQNDKKQNQKSGKFIAAPSYDYRVGYEQNDKKQKQKTAKYIAEPSYDFHPSQDKSKSYYGQPKPEQQLYEYDYSKGSPRDNSAFASRPYQNYKSRTSFVEPQFQYGFEPILLPKLLDSELATMASNDSPESEKPGMRKKIYKENWYIKKTSTSAGAPAR